MIPRVRGITPALVSLRRTAGVGAVWNPVPYGIRAVRHSPAIVVAEEWRALASCGPREKTCSQTVCGPVDQTVAGTGPDRLVLRRIARIGKPGPFAMTKLLGFVGATVGGYAGWALGALAGPFTAFLVSMIGTGVGMYYGRRIAQNIGA